MPARNTAKASAEGLEKIRTAIAQKGWRKTSPAFLDAACVSAATLKRFWRGIPISQESFEGICQSVSVAITDVADDVIATGTDASNPSESESDSDKYASERKASVAYGDIWVGRAETVRALTSRLEDTTRVLMLVGLAGVGKTALARFVACQLEGYTLIHLQCDSQSPPTLASLAHMLAQNGDRTSVSLDLSNLLTHIAQRKYLFVIDALEGLLQSDRATGYSRLQNRLWYTFFQTILSVDSCASRFILTSRSLPNELETLGESHLEQCHLHVLSGLDIDESCLLFDQLGIPKPPEPVDADYLADLAQAYAGHPSALRAIAQDITTTFGGNIAAHRNEFQSRGRNEYSNRLFPEPHEQSRHESLSASLHTRHLRRRLQPKLEHTLQQLNVQLPLAYKLLCEGCSQFSDSHMAEKLSHQWAQLAQNLMPTCDETKQPYVGASVWVDALCDRNILIPNIIDNRLYYRVHPLIYSLIAAHTRTL